jgi:uncharacterized protein (DUF2235 family)
MSKKLVVFCDGTWNRADQKTKGGRPCPTNVLRLFEATLPKSEDNEPQITHYVEGVGTRRAETLTGGMFGFGINSNIKNAYSFIVSNYDPGDQIFLFGFSRGAYTARSIAGLIYNLGILTRNNLHRVNEAYRNYKDITKTWHPDSQESQAFRKDYTHGGETIAFLGVWDTVGALGAPFGSSAGRLVNKLCQTEFHDVKLSCIIESAYHAIAIDERRWPFRPCLWQLNDAHIKKNAASQSKGDIPFYEEKWFRGVHSNVGGGYADTSLSDCSLKWMAERAKHRGLNVDLTFGCICDPRFNPNSAQAVEKSQTLVYRLTTVVFTKLPSLVFNNPLVAESPGALQLDGDYIRRPEA